MRQLDHLQQNSYAKQQEFKLVCQSATTLSLLTGISLLPLIQGLLIPEDLKHRLKCATEISKQPNSKELWLNGISFYIDTAGFQHKFNTFDKVKSIKTMTCRKADEGLERNCTAKRSHVGSGGKVLHLMVAISYRQGVILCKQYEGHINRHMFADFIRDHFSRTFKKNVNPTGKLPLQDGDPNQNSKAGKQAMQTVGATKFLIPLRSPNMNPIENVFNHVTDNHHHQAIEQQITFEDAEKYAAPVKSTLENTDISYINKRVKSMESRMLKIIQVKGKQMKY